MGYNLGEYHIIGVVVKLENRLDINIIGVFKALLIRHYTGWAAILDLGSRLQTVRSITKVSTYWSDKT